uniref:Uncharacterized protein n=1 Tax=Rhizophora mucronata TaxID=61149 RepID=A0A2P2P058_RHIMU
MHYCTPRLHQHINESKSEKLVFLFKNRGYQLTQSPKRLICLGFPKLCLPF